MLCLFSKGPTNFTTAGMGGLRDWSIVDILHKIECPTLLVTAPSDSVQELAVLPWFVHIPRIKWVELQNSTHLPHLEEPERRVFCLLFFLRVAGMSAADMCELSIGISKWCFSFWEGRSKVCGYSGSIRISEIVCTYKMKCVNVGCYRNCVVLVSNDHTRVKRGDIESSASCHADMKDLYSEDNTRYI